MVVRASKNLKKGEELFLDYNRDCFCKECNLWSFFYDNDYPEIGICLNCQIMDKCGKICKNCTGLLCYVCYDKFQIRVKN